MAEQECKLPRVHKTFWRSASLNSCSAATGSKAEKQPAKEERSGCLDRQASKSRVSLPPLQPLAIERRSLQEWPQAAMDDMDVSEWVVPTTPSRRRIKNGPDIKLDLTSMNRPPLEPTDMQLKRNKFAFYDKECSRVGDYHIYLGSDAVAKNRDTLKAHGITHVLNCVGFVCPEYFKKDFVYKTLWLQDSPGEDITSLLYDVFDYFEEVAEQDGRVFVHCCQGVSRSTSLVIAYMMWRERRSFEDALQDVKASRGVANPNMGFACQLLQCQKRVHAAPMSPSSVPRMYRLTPHSPYDPLHLVPKAVSNAGAGALDSRGAFVVHVPCAIYVWIGRDCDPKIAQAARVAAGQVVRYERAECPTHIVAEGLENDEFWESLSKCADVADSFDSYPPVKSEGDAEVAEVIIQHRKMAGLSQIERARKLGAGSKKVAAYDTDFQLYQQARQGGVVPPVPSTDIGTSPIPTRIPAREDGWSLLRQKFLSGELVPTKGPVLPTKGTFSPGATDTDPASPSLSLASSSPLFSPFSLTSSAPSHSISTGTGSESVSASPLSHLSIVSPSSSSFDSPGSTQADTSPDHRLASPYLCSGQDSFPCNPKMLPPALGSKSPAVLLAQRRGTNQSHLGSDDGPLFSMRGVSRKPRPLILTEQKMGKVEVSQIEKLESGGLIEVGTGTRDKDMQDANCISKHNDLCAFGAVVMMDDESTLTRKANLEARKSILYTWPQLEKVDVHSASSLSSKAVFVLVTPQIGKQAQSLVYVWVGREVDKGGDGGDSPWISVGQQFLEQIDCRMSIPIRVAMEGQEPEEFWEAFMS